MENLLDLSKHYIKKFSEIFESSTKAKDVKHLEEPLIKMFVNLDLTEFKPC